MFRHLLRNFQVRCNMCAQAGARNAKHGRRHDPATQLSGCASFRAKRLQSGLIGLGVSGCKGNSRKMLKSRKITVKQPRQTPQQAEP